MQNEAAVPLGNQRITVALDSDNVLHRKLFYAFSDVFDRKGLPVEDLQGLELSRPTKWKDTDCVRVGLNVRAERSWGMVSPYLPYHTLTDEALDLVHEAFALPRRERNEHNPKLAATDHPAVNVLDPSIADLPPNPTCGEKKKSLLGRTANLFSDKKSLRSAIYATDRCPASV